MVNHVLWKFYLNQKIKMKKLCPCWPHVAYSKILSHLPACTTAALTCLCSTSYWTEINSSDTLRDHKNIFLSPPPSLGFHFYCCVFSFLSVFPHFIHFFFSAHYPFVRFCLYSLVPIYNFIIFHRVFIFSIEILKNFLKFSFVSYCN